MLANTAVISADASPTRILSNVGGYLLSRSRIKYFTWRAASSRSITRFRAAWATQAVLGWAAAPRTRTRQVACSMTARTYRPVPVSAVVSNKAAAMIACQRSNVAQVVAVRWGAGSMPACWRIAQTMQAATFTPTTSSSPWMRG
jgi:hypothetical protein